MTRGVRWYLVGSLVLLALAGCGRSFFAEREPWRREAEEQCLKSGAVKQSAAVVIQKPIQGPGICGADFPLRVAALGEPSAIGYADEPVRPPGLIPRGAPPITTRGTYPASSPPASPIQSNPYRPNPYVQQATPPAASPPSSQPGGSPYGRTYVPGHTVEPGYVPAEPYQRAPAYETQAPYKQEPLEPPQQMQPDYSPYRQEPTSPGSVPPGSVPGGSQPAGSPPGARSMTRGPISLAPPSLAPPSLARPSLGSQGYEPQRDDHSYVGAPMPSPYGAPRQSYPSTTGSSYGERPLTVPARQSPPAYNVPLSPSRTPQVTGSVAATVTPTATLACPIVSALDHWIVGAVQPSATRWFGQQVVEIRQISAYSCRGMNGNPNAKISEHAFGNALDIAAFTLTDGRKVTVKDGWQGAPEEQGFLRDIQAAACAQFSTVLAPGSNVYHYDHIHVDLMRRASGRSICEPGAVSGEVVAARARARYGGRQFGNPNVTGSIAGTPMTSMSASTTSAGRAGAIPFDVETIDDDRHHPIR